MTTPKHIPHISQCKCNQLAKHALKLALSRSRSGHTNDAPVFLSSSKPTIPYTGTMAQLQQKRQRLECPLCPLCELGDGWTSALPAHLK